MIFPDFQLRVVAELGTAMELIRSLYKEYSKLTNGCCDATTAKFSGKFSSDQISPASLSKSVQIRITGSESIFPCWLPWSDLSEAAAFTHRFTASCELFNAKPSYEIRSNLLATYSSAVNGTDDDKLLNINQEKYGTIDIHTVKALFKALFYGMPFIKVP